MTHYRILLPYFRRNLGILAIGVSSLLIVDLLQLFIPRVIKLAVDDLTRYQATSARLLSYAGMVLALALGIVVFRFVWRRCLFGHSRQVEEALRNRLFAHLQTLSFSYFDRANTGDLMAHATNDVQAVQLAAGMGLVALTDTLVLGTAAIGFMLYINPSLTLIALLPMPFIALFARTISKIFYERFQKVQASFSQLTERARENLAGIRTIKAYTQETAEIKRFDQTGRNYIAANLRMVKISGFFSPMSLIFTNLSMALVLVIGGKLTILNTISVGDFVAFNSYLLLLTWPMMALGWMINLFQRGSASLGRIQAILNTPSEAAEILGVCTKTIRRWDKSGLIVCFRTIGDHRRISTIEIAKISNVESIQGENFPENSTAVYCRVSSHDQKKKGDLERQISASVQFCTEKGILGPLIFKDIASGLNTKRTGLQKMCRLIEEGTVNRVIVTYKDRLTRFGFNYLKRYFSSHGATITIINQTEAKDVQNELVQDLIAIITSFSGRVHGMRSRGKRKSRKLAKKQ